MCMSTNANTPARCAAPNGWKKPREKNMNDWWAEQTARHETEQDKIKKQLEEGRDDFKTYSKW